MNLEQRISRLEEAVGVKKRKLKEETEFKALQRNNCKELDSYLSQIDDAIESGGFEDEESENYVGSIDPGDFIDLLNENLDEQFVLTRKFSPSDYSSYFDDDSSLYVFNFDIEDYRPGSQAFLVNSLQELEDLYDSDLLEYDYIATCEA